MEKEHKKNLHSLKTEEELVISSDSTFKKRLMSMFLICLVCLVLGFQIGKDESNIGFVNDRLVSPEPEKGWCLRSYAYENMPDEWDELRGYERNHPLYPDEYVCFFVDYMPCGDNPVTMEFNFKEKENES